MRKNKIGAMFLVSILALTGVGVSYAGFTDVINIYGTVDTATVTWEVVDYSGTDVWKVWNDVGVPQGYPTELYRWEGFIGDRVTDPAAIATFCQADYAELVSTAWAMDYVDDPDYYDALLVWDNIFPCQDFAVDIVIHYTGSIPAKINDADIWTTDSWLEDLWNVQGAVFAEAYFCEPDEPGYWDISDDPVDVGTQIHTGDYIYVRLVIHLPQDNIWQTLYGEFGAYVEIVQWNEYPYNPNP